MGEICERREISLKVIVKKSNFQTVSFATIFLTMNGHMNKLLNIFNVFLTDDKGEINMV